jgi:phosphate transport system substrate-binding protein
MKTNPFSVSPGCNYIAVARNVTLVVLGLLVAGCPANNPAPEAAAGDKVIIRGSNTFGEELAPRLIAEYKKSHATALFDVESKATVYGMAALLGGKCDIAGASRVALKEELELAQMRGIELNDCIIGSYSVAVVIHGGNQLTSLTKDQVREIFTGGVTNWSAVGGPDAPINLYIRDPISGTYLGFKELAMANTAYAHGARLLPTYEGIVEAVAKDPNGVGYSSLDLAKRPGVKGVSIGGAEASVAAVNKGEYPYSRAIRLYTRKGNESARARDFIQFIQSAPGQKIVAEMGFAPRS